LTDSSQIQNSPKDRRRVPRFPFVANAEIIDADSGTKTPVQTSDLSLYGCYIRLSNALPCGTHLVIKIFTETEFFEGPATVVYSQAGSGNGLSFHDVKPHYLPTLQKWLAQAMKELTKASK
jgi:PilZ domain